MKKAVYWKQWAKENWFWLLVYGLVFVYFMARFFGQPSGSDLGQWNHFKQAITLPLVFLLAAVFIHMFSNPIILPPTEEAKASGKADELERINKDLSLQRRNWMIFAYGFMLFALLVPIYIFGPGWDKAQTPVHAATGDGGSDHAAASGVAASGVQNDAFHPMAVFIGCTLDNPKSELSCASPSEQPGEARQKTEAPKESGDTKQADSQQQANKQPAESPEAGVITRSAWALNLGGHVVNADECNQEDDSAAICRVRGGLLVPLYVIILALMGGSISLTRRLPEYQKCANPQYVSTEKEAKLTQHEFREYLIFQIIQFVSAPLIAILAYFLIDPNTRAASVALAFTSGFASESILLMVRAAAVKLSPTSESPKNGTVSGVVTLAGAGGQPAKSVEIVLTAVPQVRALTDDTGFYVLHNVPVGEHGVKVSLTDYEPATGSVKIERAQELVKQHWILKKKA